MGGTYGWQMIEGLVYNGCPLYHNRITNEIAYEDLTMDCRLGNLPAEAETLVREALA